MTLKNFATRPESQAAVAKMAAKLRELSAGEIFTYADIQAVTELNLDRYKYLLIAARRTVEAQDGVRFSTVFRVGIKRLLGEDIPGIGIEARRSIRRKAKNVYKRLTGLAANDISTEDQKRIDLERSVMGAVAELMVEKKPVVREGTTSPVKMPEG